MGNALKKARRFPRLLPDWSEYRAGFGDQAGGFWLGLDKIHRLTASRASELRVDLGNWNGKGLTAEFGDEQSLYVPTVGSYSGTAGDSGEPRQHEVDHYKDKDDESKADSNWAVDYPGAWWCSHC